MSAIVWRLLFRFIAGLTFPKVFQITELNCKTLSCPPRQSAVRRSCIPATFRTSAHTGRNPVRAFRCGWLIARQRVRSIRGRDIQAPARKALHTVRDRRLSSRNNPSRHLSGHEPLVVRAGAIVADDIFDHPFRHPVGSSKPSRRPAQNVERIRDHLPIPARHKLMCARICRRLRTKGINALHFGSKRGSKNRVTLNWLI